MMMRVSWSDGELVHVARLGWRRLETFCGAAPSTSKTLERPLDINGRVNETPTCLVCTANEERKW